MKLEVIIRTASKWIAGVVVFLMASGFYLSSKGFVMGPNGPVLATKTADAAVFGNSGPELKKVRSNLALPEGRHLGKDTAPLTLYEFSSFGCYHCADFHLNTLPKIMKEYVDTGLLKVVFEPFPLDKRSMQAAMISECIPDDKYYQFVELVFKKQREWSLSSKGEQILSQYAALSGINDAKVKACLSDDNIAKNIISDRQYAMDELGIQGTPSFVIAQDGVREVLYGAPSYNKLKGILDVKLGREQKK